MSVPVQAAGDLVQLKALLDQAVAAAGSGAPLQRLTAVVLLDAVNERALHVAAPAVGVTPRERDSLDSVAQAVADAKQSAADAGAAVPRTGASRASSLLEAADILKATEALLRVRLQGLHSSGGNSFERGWQRASRQREETAGTAAGSVDGGWV